MANSKISALTSATTPLAGTEVLPVVQSGATTKVSVANLTAGRDVSTNSVAVAAGVPVYLNGTSGNTQILYYASLVIDMQINGTKGFRLYAPGAGTSELRGDWTTTTSSGGSGNFTVLGNVIQGTAGKGINFTANTALGGMTSQLLNWYEEGTFTPTITGSSTAITLTYTTQTGKYFRVGKLVTVMAYVKVNTVTVAGSGFLILNTSLWNSDGSPAVGSVSFGKVTYSSYATSQMRSSGSSSIVFVNSSTTGAPPTVNATDVVSGSEMYVTITYATP